MTQPPDEREVASYTDPEPHPVVLVVIEAKHMPLSCTRRARVRDLVQALCSLGYVVYPSDPLQQLTEQIPWSDVGGPVETLKAVIADYLAALKVLPEDLRTPTTFRLYDAVRKLAEAADRVTMEPSSIEQERVAALAAVREHVQDARDMMTMDRARFGHIWADPNDPFPTTEEEVDDFVKRRTQVWRETWLYRPLDRALARLGALLGEDGK